jgi:folylpolyglutamate synthase/dihydrofolate synthase
MATRTTIDLTLERIQKLAFFLPPYTRPTCHITGTNGKGSVSALLSSIFLASSPPLNVGRFNSPHLISVHDSIVINDEPVENHVYSVIRSEVEGADRRHGIGASNFEILMLTALLVFERAHVDIAVVEVGMGGRLDATNIIPDDCIVVSALTAVDLDHQAFLGDTVALIAKEKAGIARNGKPFVIGPQKYPEVEEVVRSVVAEKGGFVRLAPSAVKRTGSGWFAEPIVAFSSSFQNPSSQPVRIAMPCFNRDVDVLLPLHGNHQLDNLGIAATVVSTLLTHSWCVGTPAIDLRERITPESISQGVGRTTWPGRVSFHKITPRCLPTADSALTQSTSPLVVLVDGAHNAACSSALAAFISDLFETTQSRSRGQADGKSRSISLTYVLALSHSPPKTPLQTLTPLLSPNLPLDIRVKTNVAVLRFTPPDGMPWVKSTAPSELRQAVLAVLPDAHMLALDDDDDPAQGSLCRVLEWAVTNQQESEEHLVVLTGSLYLVADFYRLVRDGIVL